MVVHVRSYKRHEARLRMNKRKPLQAVNLQGIQDVFSIFIFFIWLFSAIRPELQAETQAHIKARSIYIPSISVNRSIISMFPAL